MGKIVVSVAISADARHAVATLRKRDGDTVVFGSRTLWGDLLAHGLIDELHLPVGPVHTVVSISVSAIGPANRAALSAARTCRVETATRSSRVDVPPDAPAGRPRTRVER